MLVRHTEDFQITRDPWRICIHLQSANTALLGLIAPGRLPFSLATAASLLLCIAASFLWYDRVIYRSRLTIDVRYRDWRHDIRIHALLQVQRSAWPSRAAAYSYVIPRCSRTVETAFGFVLYRQWPTIQLRSSSENFLSIFRSSRWVMLGAAMFPSPQRDYMRSVYHDAAMVGQYFFAFQLVSAVGP